MAIRKEKYLLSKLAMKMHIPRRFKLKEWDQLAQRSVSVRVSRTLNLIVFFDFKSFQILGEINEISPSFYVLWHPATFYCEI